MVCAKQNIFSTFGVPLTRSAALMLTDAASGIGNASAATALDVTASAVTPLVFESCAGYTSQDYQSCPKGQKVNPLKAQPLKSPLLRSVSGFTPATSKSVQNVSTVLLCQPPAGPTLTQGMALARHYITTL